MGSKEIIPWQCLSTLPSFHKYKICSWGNVLMFWRWLLENVLLTIPENECLYVTLLFKNSCFSVYCCEHTLGADPSVPCFLFIVNSHISSIMGTFDKALVPSRCREVAIGRILTQHSGKSDSNWCEECQMHRQWLWAFCLHIHEHKQEWRLHRVQLEQW